MHISSQFCNKYLVWPVTSPTFLLLAHCEFDNPDIGRTSRCYSGLEQESVDWCRPDQLSMPFRLILTEQSLKAVLFLKDFEIFLILNLLTIL